MVRCTQHQHFYELAILFSPQSFFEWIEAVVLQPDGKVLVAGATPSLTSRTNLIRLHTDGSIDRGFQMITGPDAVEGVYALALQNDGKVVIGGLFYSLRSQPLTSIARLNSDGSLDASFQPGTGPNDAVLALALQADGKILVGGMFDHFNGIPRKHIARLHGGPSASSMIAPTLRQSPTDQSALVGKKVVLGVAAQGTAPLKYQWEKDGQPIDGATNPLLIINNVQLGHAGQYRVTVTNEAGAVTSDTAEVKILEPVVNPEVLDQGFAPEVVPNSTVQTVALQADGALLFGGGFRTVDGIVQSNLARLNPMGNLDTTFRPLVNSSVVDIALTADQNLYIGGLFSSVGGLARRYVARLGADGQVDRSFDPQSAMANCQHFDCLAVQPDGRLLVAGSFPAGSTHREIIRLLTDGRQDLSFASPTTFENASLIYSIAVSSAGDLYLGGAFRYNLTQTFALVRLSAAGLWDSQFSFPTPANASIHQVQFDAEGRLLVNGHFHSIGSFAVSNLARLYPDGSVDTDFHPTAVEQGTCTFAVLAPDGKMVTATDLSSEVKILRLNPDGSVDPDYSWPITVSNTVKDIVRQRDGQIIVGGWITSVAGVSRSGLARIAEGAKKITPVQLTHQPFGGVVKADTDVTLQVAATGSEPLTFQWYKNDLLLTGKNTETLLLDHVSISDAGLYRAVVSNEGGAVLSSPAQILVTQPFAAQASRLNLNSSAQQLIHLRLKGVQENRPVSIFTAENLDAWTLLSTDPAPGSTIEFFESIPAGKAQRYYRWQQ